MAVSVAIQHAMQPEVKGRVYRLRCIGVYRGVSVWVKCEEKQIVKPIQGAIQNYEYTATRKRALALPVAYRIGPFPRVIQPIELCSCTGRR